MGRPPTTRRVGTGLKTLVFKPYVVPMDQLERVELTLDGLEALRLADHLGLYQEEAAQRMGVSRATFARVLAAARSVVAEALLEGKALEIGGGDVVTGPSRREGCPIHARKERRGRNCRCSSATGQTQEA